LKLARLADWQIGLVLPDGHIVDVPASLRQLEQSGAYVSNTDVELFSAVDWSPLIENWTTAKDTLTALAEIATRDLSAVVSRPAAETILRPPITSPTATIFAAGANFADHAAAAKSLILKKEITEEEVRAEKDAGLPPWGFIVLPRSISGPGAVVSPPASTTMFDYEAEVAITLRSGGRDLQPADLDVWGFTAWNDLSIRDHIFGRGTAVDRGILVWALSKNFDTGNACGPWMVVDEGHDVDRLEMCTRVNGSVRQKSSTANMIYSFGDILAHISAYVTLRPGDMFTSGTPAGATIESGADGDYLRPGDEVEINIGDAAILKNTVG
jgi:2-keto-4-pentenoate hydratase/2-oxohepta-3-ene-1,7-dioic acid hydratase in catechol pathway